MDLLTGAQKLRLGGEEHPRGLAQQRRARVPRQFTETVVHKHPSPEVLPSGSPVYPGVLDAIAGRTWIGVPAGAFPNAARIA